MRRSSASKRTTARRLRCSGSPTGSCRRSAARRRCCAPSREHGPEPALRAFAAPEAERAFVVDQVRALQGGGVPYEEMAVLCRTNARLADFEEPFHEAKIPFQGAALLSREAARQLLKRLSKLRRDAGRGGGGARLCRGCGLGPAPAREARRARAGPPIRSGPAREARGGLRRRLAHDARLHRRPGGTLRLDGARPEGRPPADVARSEGSRVRCRVPAARRGT